MGDGQLPGTSILHAFKLVPVDLTPPVISLVAADPAVIWPPDGRLVPVRVSVAATDNVDLAPRCMIDAVTVDAAPAPAQDVLITGDLTLEIRASRAGTSLDGLTYGIGVKCTDEAGNSAIAATSVVVPHDSSISLQ